MSQAQQDNADRRGLYPPIEPYMSEMIQMDDIHNVYWEVCGNKEGKPVIFCHGGPGGGCSSFDRQWFNPDKYMIVLFDQRGAGRSTPHANLENNTTQHLIADMEVIRKKLGIEKWQVFGGSWGSTLSLAYAEEHPDKVTELVLRGIFTLRRSELETFYDNKGGIQHLFPEAWEGFVKPIPVEERDDMIAAYGKRLFSDDEHVRLTCAKAWSQWEGATSKLLPDPKFVDHYGEDKFALAFARIECHYFNQGGFYPEGHLLANAHKLSHIPTTIVNGRYDCVCPMKTAWELSKQMPHAELYIIPDAGHNSQEPGTKDRLIRATDKYADL
ncbi:proline iminopeptidase [Sphaeroforma arctica JP610]|uniref:Proline iminopeptidase n=1 Tax=Sphaeroforma arctica JP610 TaxID=667725 RepID=A0A0L0GAB5_9EUKA|nr:proline iminopeptidase [Sphaeroforma arctica JP610]KNC85849.1 proline iminopeptidase [Sphaeroforma arctica JP610]|eukprot:XP_014159751.1 proline iminopeptidase [Sphaeroforma arctica JP610]